MRGEGGLNGKLNETLHTSMLPKSFGPEEIKIQDNFALIVQFLGDKRIYENAVRNDGIHDMYVISYNFYYN